MLRIPLLGRLVLRLPFMPRLAACLGKRLPSRVVRPNSTPNPNPNPNPNPTQTPTQALTLTLTLTLSF